MFDFLLLLCIQLQEPELLLLWKINISLIFCISFLLIECLNLWFRLRSVQIDFVDLFLLICMFNQIIFGCLFILCLIYKSLNLSHLFLRLIRWLLY
jgi:hypothetical protein